MENLDILQACKSRGRALVGVDRLENTSFFKVPKGLHCAAGAVQECELVPIFRCLYGN